MAKKIKFVVPEIAKKFQTEESVIVEGFEVIRGDIIKVKGQHGLKFKFHGYTTNVETGSTWVDCFELQKGMSTTFRAFKLEDIKRVPKKRKRAKRVV
jgi:hypothetical protein